MQALLAGELTTLVGNGLQRVDRFMEWGGQRQPEVQEQGGSRRRRRQLTLARAERDQKGPDRTEVYLPERVRLRPGDERRRLRSARPRIGRLWRTNYAPQTPPAPGRGGRDWERSGHGRDELVCLGAQLRDDVVDLLVDGLERQLLQHQSGQHLLERNAHHPAEYDDRREHHE